MTPRPGYKLIEVRLVFSDWLRRYPLSPDPEVELELSLGDFHSGSTFRGYIEVAEDHEEDLRRAEEQGYEPVFYIPSIPRPRPGE